MALDLSSLLLGLAAASVPLLAFIWQLQRRASGHHAELACSVSVLLQPSYPRKA